MGFKDLSSFEKKTKDVKECKNDCASTEFSKELTPKTTAKNDSCKK